MIPDGTAVGRTVIVNGKPMTIISITPDPNATASPAGQRIDRNWKRKGDMLVDINSGETRPWRTLSKDEKELYEGNKKIWERW